MGFTKKGKSLDSSLRKESSCPKRGFLTEGTWKKTKKSLRGEENGYKKKEREIHPTAKEETASYQD